ncbi:MAG: SCO family protein [Candidatus Dormibacteria bacterium]
MRKNIVYWLLAGSLCAGILSSCSSTGPKAAGQVFSSMILSHGSPTLHVTDAKLSLSTAGHTSVALAPFPALNLLPATLNTTPPPPVATTGVPSGTYVSASVSLNANGTTIHYTSPILLTIGSGPAAEILVYLVTHQVRTATVPVVATIAAGTHAVNFVTHIAQGSVQKIPGIPLVNQYGKTISSSFFQGHITILATFLTDCTDVCLLTASGLWDVAKQLDAMGLGRRVQIVEVTVNPAEDTPPVLLNYARAFGIPWTLLTGSTTSVNAFWHSLGFSTSCAGSTTPVLVCPEPWGDSQKHVNPYSHQIEPYNLSHGLYVGIADPTGTIFTTYANPPYVKGAIESQFYNALSKGGRQIYQTELTNSTWRPSAITNDVLSLMATEDIAAPQATAAPIGVRKGDVPPAFTLSSTAGGSYISSHDAHSPRVINFFATWCVSCRDELPLLVSTVGHGEFATDKLVLIDERESSTTVTAYLKELHLKTPVLLDTNGNVYGKYGFEGLPVSLFVSSTNVINAIVIGQLTKPTLTKVLHELH